MPRTRQLKFIFLFLSILIIVEACSDFLTEDTSAYAGPDSKVIRSEQGLYAALVGAYKPLSYTWTSGLSTSKTISVCMGDDILTCCKPCSKADPREFDQFNVNPMNYSLNYIWDGAYHSITGANIVIKNYSKTSGNRNNINQIAGEAYFLRAYSYFWIARLWEKAPLILKYDFSAQEVSQIKPSGQEELYHQIITDCDSAISIMSSNTRILPGRAGKASAIALKAEALLHMAGYPLKKTEKYAEAAKVAKELIDNKEKYGLALLEDFANLWQAEYDGNSEEIFALTFSGTEENWNSNALYGASARPMEENGWGDEFCELTFFNNYPEQYRKECTFKTIFKMNINGEIVETPWNESWNNRLYFKKFEGEENIWYLSQSLPLERFAEVYFIYAEAEFMSGGNKEEAVEALNTIVRRAYHEPLYSRGTHDYTANELTQDIILQEKAYEHAGEWVRWFDLIRTEKVEEANSTKDPDDLQPFYSIDKSDYFMPIPYAEAQLNPNL